MYCSEGFGQVESLEGHFEMLYQGAAKGNSNFWGEIKESMTFYPWFRSCKVRSKISLPSSSPKTLNIEALEVEEKVAISLAEELWVEEEKEDEEEDELAEELGLLAKTLGFVESKEVEDMVKREWQI